MLIEPRPPRIEALTPEETERFWGKVIIGSAEECWLWSACLDRDGYGRFHRRDSYDRAHRVSWLLATGIQPGILEVCHDCPGGDNPSCVNPNHLWLGTPDENHKDRDSKGRCPVGSRHGRSKLSDNEVREIRDKSAKGQTNVSLAAEYNVSDVMISLIVRRKNWIHVA